MRKNIYENGIKFKCQGSANCCVSRGSYGYVFLSKKDQKKLAKYLSISLEKFIFKYCHITDGFTHLKEIKKNGECFFLNKKRCSVYQARPTQCRTWPFWPENMNSKSWSENVLNFCPGVGKGSVINKNNIEKKLKIDLNNEKIIFEEQKINLQLK